VMVRKITPMSNEELEKLVYAFHRNVKNAIKRVLEQGGEITVDVPEDVDEFYLKITPDDWEITFDFGGPVAYVYLKTLARELKGCRYLSGVIVRNLPSSPTRVFTMIADDEIRIHAEFVEHKLHIEFDTGTGFMWFTAR